MLSKVFIADVVERALKTVAQVVLALLTVEGANVLALNWSQVWKSAATAGAISVLTSIVSAQARGRATASLTVNPPTPPPSDTDIKG